MSTSAASDLAPVALDARAPAAEDAASSYSSSSAATGSSSSATSHSTTAREPATTDDDEVTAGAAVTANPLFKPLTSDEDEDDEEDCYVNGPRDALQEGILGLLRPTLETLDRGVSQTREAQNQLRVEIEALNRDLTAIQASGGRETQFRELDSAVDKLNQAKKRVIVVANLLQGAQDRLNRVHQSCLQETAQRRAHLDHAAGTTGASVGFKS